jgi:hypothetical protein
MPRGIYRNTCVYRKKHDGYIHIRVPKHPFADAQGFVREHRLVYEMDKKCVLLPWTQVHHINEKRDDNRINNMEIITNADHCGLHIRKRLIMRYCPLCGKEFKTHPHKKIGRLCRQCYKLDWQRKHRDGKSGFYFTDAEEFVPS